MCVVLILLIFKGNEGLMANQVCKRKKPGFEVPNKYLTFLVALQNPAF